MKIKAPTSWLCKPFINNKRAHPLGCARFNLSQQLLVLRLIRATWSRRRSKTSDILSLLYDAFLIPMPVQADNNENTGDNKAKKTNGAKL